MPSSSEISPNGVNENSELKKEGQQTNILLIMSDQQRFDTLGLSEESFLYTPNFKRLIKEGCLFNYGYTPSPDGMPARHNILTGLTGRSHGYLEYNRHHSMPSSIPTFPQLLSDRGYETLSIGKNEFYPVRRHRGFDRVHLMEDRPSFREEDDYLCYLKSQGYGHILHPHGVSHLLKYHPQRALIPEEHQGDTWATTKAIEFFNTNKNRHPWCLQLGWNTPHPPQNPADRFVSLYSETLLSPPLQSKTALSPLGISKQKLRKALSEEELNAYKKRYFSAISQIDFNLGRILDALEETKQRENTLICFCSNHGSMLGDYGIMGKGLPYDTCTHIPFILSWPQKIEGEKINDEFVDLNDLFPTILDAAKIDLKPFELYPGESLLKEKDLKKDRTKQFSEYSSGIKRWVSMRTKTHKYTYYYHKGYEEFFNLEIDPQEKENLFLGYGLQDDQKIIYKQMKENLIAYEAEWGPEGCIEDNDFIKITGSDEFRFHKMREVPIFQNQIMDDFEKKRMNSFYDEILEASKEENYKLSDLDLTSWQQEYNLSEKAIKEMLEKESKIKD